MINILATRKPKMKPAGLFKFILKLSVPVLVVPM